MSRRRAITSLRVTACLLTLIVAGLCQGCATLAPPSAEGTATAQPFEAPATQRLLAAGFTQVRRFHVDPPPPDAAVMASLAGLTRLDPALSLRRTGELLILRRANRDLARITLAAAPVGDDWARRTTRLVVAARRASPAVAAAPERLHTALFEGLVRGLDRYSSYAPPGLAGANSAADDGFGRLGIRVAAQETGARIVSVHPEAPAGRAGLAAGDVITHLDGRPLAGLDAPALRHRLERLGERDCRLKVRTRHGAQRRVTLRPAARAPSVDHRRMDDVVYLRIHRFSRMVPKVVSTVLREAATDQAAFAGVVLDLRDTPGGVLSAAVATADLFLDSGRIVAVKGRHPKSRHSHDATPDDLAGGRPLAVLINGGTASAAEVLANALKQAGRAVLIGSPTYGKDSVQLVRRLPDGARLVLTWARHLGPDGRSVHPGGVRPDLCTAHRAPELRGRVTGATRDRCPRRRDQPNADLAFALKSLRTPTSDSPARQAKLVPPDTGQEAATTGRIPDRAGRPPYH